MEINTEANRQKEIEIGEVETPGFSTLQNRKYGQNKRNMITLFTLGLIYFSVGVILLFFTTTSSVFGFAVVIEVLLGLCLLVGGFAIFSNWRFGTCMHFFYILLFLAEIMMVIVLTIYLLFYASAILGVYMFYSLLGFALFTLSVKVSREFTKESKELFSIYANV